MIRDTSLRVMPTTSAFVSGQTLNTSVTFTFTVTTAVSARSAYEAMTVALASAADASPLTSPESLTKSTALFVARQLTTTSGMVRPPTSRTVAVNFCVSPAQSVADAGWISSD